MPDSMPPGTDTGATLTELRHSAGVPGQPDRRRIHEWLHRSYLSFWAAA
jgi:hypothetical protein